MRWWLIGALLMADLGVVAMLHSYARSHSFIGDPGSWHVAFMGDSSFIAIASWLVGRVAMVGLATQSRRWIPAMAIFQGVALSGHVLLCQAAIVYRGIGERPFESSFFSAAEELGRWMATTGASRTWSASVFELAFVWATVMLTSLALYFSRLPHRLAKRTLGVTSE